MATKTDKLVIELTTDGAGNVRASLAGVSKDLKSVDESAKKSKESFISLKQILGAIGTTAIVKGLIDANVEYQKLSASLKTVTGSQESANAAFSKLEEFAATTPYQLENVVGSFIKLKALGLDPSIDALTSYGNTAAAMGKDLDQLIEAVADAATGEFERLKDFGIKASQQGDKVTFTFRGVKTTVQKDAADIEKYLQSLGKNEFATGMNDQMLTLGGAFSNVQDSVNGLARAVGDAGLNEALNELAHGITDLTNDITGFVKNPASMPEWMKQTAFGVKYLAAEFVDLGDVIGATGAILATEVGPGMFDKIDAILEERKRKREALEKDLENFVARMNGIEKAASSGSDKSNSSADPFATTQKSSRASADNAKDIQRILDALEKETAAYGKTSDELAIYQLKLLGASDAQISVAETSIALRREQEGLAKLAADIAAQDTAYAESARKLHDELERGAITYEEYSKKMDELDAGGKMKETATIGEAAMQRLEAAARGWGDQFTNTVADMVKKVKLDFSDLADSIISDLLRIAIYQNITAPLFGGLGIPGFSAPTAHTGGIVGQLTGSSFVNPMVFAGAPRYHSGGMAGLGPNEVPAILNKGEEVLTANDPRHRNNMSGSNQVKVEIVKNGSPIEVESADAKFDFDGAVVTVFLRDYQRGGPISQRIKQSNR